MANEKERKIFDSHILSKNLKNSRQRELILEAFLSAEGHLTADGLYEIVKKKNPGIGYATVYRTLRLLCDSGISRELKLEGGTKYEHLYGHRHHDHLICTKCGRLVEVYAPEIEDLQEKLFKAHGFRPERHRLELYGICKKCKR